MWIHLCQQLLCLFVRLDWFPGCAEATRGEGSGRGRRERELNRGRQRAAPIYLVALSCRNIEDYFLTFQNHEFLLVHCFVSAQPFLVGIKLPKTSCLTVSSKTHIHPKNFCFDARVRNIGAKGRPWAFLEGGGSVYKRESHNSTLGRPFCLKHFNQTKCWTYIKQIWGWISQQDGAEGISRLIHRVKISIAI